MRRGVVDFPHCCCITLADCPVELEESRRILQIPILKVPNQPPHIGSLVSPGWFVDPVLSMIQHSCEPNARPVVEDGKIMVLALKDIPVNGEITFDYVLDNWLYDYSFRALALSGDWGISCCCPTCEKGQSRIPETEQEDFGLMLNEAFWHTMNTPVCEPETKKKYQFVDCETGAIGIWYWWRVLPGS